MDSITQIVLGAACGEAVLGKKIGNKALLFGAIGGTIPRNSKCHCYSRSPTTT